MPSESENVGIALALVMGAGAATAIGASVVFFPSLVKLASRRVLAGSLGLSAGVMTYVSFVEIFSKSVLSFEDAGFDENTANVYATLSFFGGVLAMKFIEIGVGLLSREHRHNQEIHDTQRTDKGGSVDENESQRSTVAPHGVCCSEDPVRELNEWHQMAEKEILEANDDNQLTIASNSSTGDSGSNNGDTLEKGDASCQLSLDDKRQEDVNAGDNIMVQTAMTIENTPQLDEDTKSKGNKAAPCPPNEENKKLVRMGLNTALAIALHNFPEGLASFVAALNDPQVGAVLAVAIGIHNIPEGLCVALPIYYATGNRRKAFLWGCISGISEPVAALLGWAVLANNFSDDLYALLFGLVSGMMVIISLKELLPTAHRYDPEDSVVTCSTIAGMVVIALSLVLFRI